jgi:hypothetical protein
MDNHPEIFEVGSGFGADQTIFSRFGKAPSPQLSFARLGI